VERKMETTFVGVDAGFNLAVEPAVYGLPFHPVPALRLPGDCRNVTIVGNINEALDVWYANINMPPLEEGQTLALINAGAYSSAMASNHCMRGEYKEFLLT
jgi:diaminopimelate decarboxylase